MAVAGFVRLVTNPRVFMYPGTIEDAVAFVDAVLRVKGVEMATCGREWPNLRQLLLSRERGGNFVTDAWNADAVQSCAEYLVTLDRDFEGLLPARDRTLSK